MDKVFEIIEEGAKGVKNELESQIERLYIHLLKYKYQKDHQTRAGINTILDSCKQITQIKTKYTSIWNNIEDEDLDKIYSKAVIKASRETMLPKSVFSEYRSDLYNKENISNRLYLKEFMKNNVYSIYAKEEIDKWNNLI